MDEASLESIYKAESRKVFATLVRLLGDFELAEEATQEAFAAALEKWPEKGIPQNPSAWLITAGRFKTLDILKRRAKLRSLQPDLQHLLSDLQDRQEQLDERDIQDDRLRLIFTCCHPALDPKVQIALTLREVCGLTTEEIARAFLVKPATLAQRLVRGKNKIRQAKIPYTVPALEELPRRLDSVLSVVYLIFNEGYSASSGSEAIRAELCEEAIHLQRTLLELLPEPEVKGLLTLMLLHESRRSARVDQEGDIVLLEEQDRSLWDQAKIAEGIHLVEEALASSGWGIYTLQAAISAVHAQAASPQQTDWAQIVALYRVLFQLHPTPVVELNLSVARAMDEGHEVGLNAIEEILERGELTEYHLAHSARGELLRRLGRLEKAREAFQKALKLAEQSPEKSFLQKKIQDVDLKLSQSSSS
ncbi:MAG TPA: RNA polymerase sigma factor [Phycisphaerales bacterium]|nr:RNA polymerase sigma factor [Phycisphaerales bacterium]